jgi:hypothetical protein
LCSVLQSFDYLLAEYIHCFTDSERAE